MAEIDINDDDWIVDLESNIVRHKTALHEGLEIKMGLSFGKWFDRLEYHNSVVARKPT
ncbi:MAG: hypothetical protein ACRBBJ_15305 [Rhodomicrobiaceae bacterium]